MKAIFLPVGVLLLALTLCGASSAFSRPQTSDHDALGASVLTLNQGTVARPLNPCGFRMAIQGHPGSRYTVFVIEPGQPPLRVSSGVVPPTGSFTHSAAKAGCTQKGPWSRAQVISVSDAPLRVTFNFL